jgi:PAS domain S-box-containing protein
MRVNTAGPLPEALTKERCVAALLALAFFGSAVLLFWEPVPNRLNPLLNRAIHIGVAASISVAFYICWLIFRRRDARGSPLDLNDAPSPDIDAARRREATAPVDTEGVSADEALVFEKIPGMTCVVNRFGILQHLNRRSLDYFGGRDGDLCGAAWMTVVHPDDQAATAQAWHAAVESSAPMASQHRLRKLDGTYGWHHTRMEPEFGVQGHVLRWHGLFTSIEDRLIPKNEPDYQVMLNAIPALIWRADPAGAVDYVNQRCIDYCGLTVQQHADGGWQGLVHPADVQLVERRYLECLRTKELFDMTYRFKRKDGVYRWMHVLAAPLTATDGRIVNWYGIHIDVDEQKAAEDALAESERRLSLIIETIPAMVWRARPDGELDYVSPRCTQNLGMVLEELQQHGWLRPVHPDDVEVTLERWKISETTGRLFEATYRFLIAGTYRWMKATAAPLRDQQTGQILSWYGIHVDIDEQKRAENALRASEQNLRAIMESSKAMEAALRTTQLRLERASQIATVAELSASIAHEINQPLSAVAANSHACARWLAAEPPNLKRARVAAQCIVADANSAAQVVERVRALFKRAAPEKTVLDINDVIQQVLLLMQDEILEKKVSATVELDPAVPHVLADRVQIQQILINLIRNATEAMEKVTDSIKLVTLSSRRQGPDAIEVQICDCGIGIEDVNRVFDPFFTTKDKGMGVGLSICLSIIEAHGGRLWAAANHGPGTTFSFSLPVHAEAVT